MNIKSAFHLILIFTFLSSCTSTKAVNEFATASKQSLELFSGIPYSFAQNCYENCIQEKIKEAAFQANDCACAGAFAADSVTLVLFTQLDEYLTGLAALSAKNIQYKTAGLGTALATGSYGNLTVGKEEADAFSGLSAIMLNALAGKHKKKKLKQYVTSANEPFQKLIELLNFNISQNLGGLLQNQKLLFRSSYLSIARDTGLSAYEKRKVMEDYYQHAGRLEQHQRTLNTYSKALLKIGQGHHQLTDNISEINDAEVHQMLLRAAGDMKALIAQFKVLIK